MKIVSALVLGFFISISANAKCPCKEEVKKHCSGLNKEEKKTCIKTNKSKFSKQCQEIITVKENIETSCGPDIEKYCKDLKGKEKRTCVKKNKDKFSDSCKKAHEAMKACKCKNKVKKGKKK